MVYNNIKHLEFIQNIVKRMATNSFILKGWTITLISILFALAINSNNKSIVILAIFPTLIFWGLDAYYLRQERLFRKLFDYVRKNELNKKEFYILDTSIVKNDVQSWKRTLISLTILPLHLIIILLIIGILVIGGGV